MKLRPAAVLAASALLLSALVGCAADTSPTPAPSETEAGLSGSLTIYAATSLKASFDETAAAFLAENPGVTIVPIVYGGSSTLVTQLIEGAPADVFASADENNMQKAVDADLLADPAQLFATNTLVIAMPSGNPAGITALEDLADPATIVVLCAVEVPCGAASERLLTAAGVTVTARSYEENVGAVLTKVAANEADAGLVYRTDVAARTDVEHIVPAGAADIVNRYPIAALSDAANPDVAAAFIAFVLGPVGQGVLAAHGFGTP